MLQCCDSTLYIFQAYTIVTIIFQFLLYSWWQAEIWGVLFIFSHIVSLSKLMIMVRYSEFCSYIFLYNHIWWVLSAAHVFLECSIFSSNHYNIRHQSILIFPFFNSSILVCLYIHVCNFLLLFLIFSFVKRFAMQLCFNILSTQSVIFINIVLESVLKSLKTHGLIQSIYLISIEIFIQVTNIF